MLSSSGGSCFSLWLLTSKVWHVLILVLWNQFLRLFFKLQADKKQVCLRMIYTCLKRDGEVRKDDERRRWLRRWLNEKTKENTKCDIRFQFKIFLSGCMNKWKKLHKQWHISPSLHPRNFHPSIRRLCNLLYSNLRSTTLLFLLHSLSSFFIRLLSHLLPKSLILFSSFFYFSFWIKLRFW